MCRLHTHTTAHSLLICEEDVGTLDVAVNHGLRLRVQVLQARQNVAR